MRGMTLWIIRNTGMTTKVPLGDQEVIVMTELKGGDYFSPSGHENWRITEKHDSGGGTGGGGGKGLGIVLIIVGVILAAIFPPLGILIWIGAKTAS